MTPIPQTVKEALERQRFLRWSKIALRRLARYITPPVYVLVFTAIAVVLLFPFTSTFQSIDLPQTGEAARETVIAPFTFDILKPPDQLARERKAAADKVPLVLDYDADKTRKMRAALQDLKKEFFALGDRRWADSAGKTLHRELSRVVSDNALKILLKHPDLVASVANHAESALNKGIVNVVIAPTRDKLREMQDRFNAPFDNAIIYPGQFVTLRRDSTEMPVDLKDMTVREAAFESIIGRLRQGNRYGADTLNAAYELLAAFVMPNVSVAENETDELRAKAAQDVLPISGKVIKETEIVHKHQEVTPEVLVKLRSLRAAMAKMENVRERNRIWSGNAGRLVLVLIGLMFLAFYFSRRQPVLLKNTRHLAAFALILTFQLLIVRLCLFLIPRLFESGEDTLFVQPEYLIPTAAAAVLSAILFGQELSLVLVLYTSTCLGIVLGFDQFMFVYALFTGIVAVVSSRNIRYRWEYFKIIPAMLAVALACVSMWHLINYRFAFVPLFQDFGLAAVNVGLSLFFAMASSPIFERIFDITTNMTLVELSDMNHPVLKRLSIEAAGTYNHSVLVGNLAESAAAKIGANPLLARVASYYHDIGKIEKSDYFVENALGLDRNKHNKLAPSMSALIILSHVKEGVELARQYRLPAVIKDIITQHHGTGWVSFFYEKALEQDPHKQVQEQDFRYPGPPPQTRETAIIMLADSVEAASRSLGTSSPKLLRELVKKIIRDKFMDGQLDQCTLTLRDLDGIVEGFMPVLQGMFHSRIKYPNK